MPVEKGNHGERKEKAVADFARNPPGTAWIFFTDGSALGNPGPCGGGYVHRRKGEDVYSEAIFPLGHGDNNKGEMGGIHGSLQRVMTEIGNGEMRGRDSVYIFSDSALCIGYLDRGWHFPHWKELAQDTRGLLLTLRKRVDINFHWIRGHAGIPGNELADAAAKKAANKAKAGLEEVAGAAVAAVDVNSGDEANT